MAKNSKVRKEKIVFEGDELQMIYRALIGRPVKGYGQRLLDRGIFKLSQVKPLAHKISMVMEFTR